ncbi:phosphosulfolactate synthase [Natrinema halophilum]|uniref:phosphosulfolactate synthase n=1 Tax=Natrinema halophilum TaxID=1699371 RepID=UPI001F38F686|nr:phosphosulfolactate synthase [Natrinema halophilum]UHQ96390.1 phosphosulfolactate synthase [Natrinema halophilum]
MDSQFTYMGEDYSFMHEDRTKKPRQRGLTMAEGAMFQIEGEHYVEDLCQYIGPYIDLYKFAYGAFALEPPELLQSKLMMFDEHDITAFPGGITVEAAFHEGCTTRYMEHLRDVGIPGIEISSTVVDMAPEEKMELIERADELGFYVISEIGKKAVRENVDEGIDIGDAVDELQQSLDAGADMTIFEMQEVESQIRDEESSDKAVEVVDAIVDNVGIENVIFEVPFGDYYDVLGTTWWFIDTVGKEVNLGNVNPEYIMPLEQQRRKMGTFSFSNRVS